MTQIRVYLACSLDGYIAGPNDDLAWLTATQRRDVLKTGDSLGFEELMSETGAILMGRHTYDVVCGFDGQWPYGETPVIVATNRELDPCVPTVSGRSGSIESLLQHATEVAGDDHVYLDGGSLVKAALAAHLVDELIITWVPTILGGGVSLFEGLPHLEFEYATATGHVGGMLQTRLTPAV